MSRMGRIVSTACVGLVLATIVGDAAIAKPQHSRRSGEVIRAWNEIARAQAFGNPIRFWRILAIMHAAQHDADLPSFVPAGVRLDLVGQHDEGGTRYCTAVVVLMTHV